MQAMRSEFPGRTIGYAKEYGGTVGARELSFGKGGKVGRGGLCGEGFVSVRSGEAWQMGAFAVWQKREIRRGKRGDREDREDPVWGRGRVGAIHCCC